ncbi:hypothetical protein QA584_03200 [Anaerocolumna sp. AGMB13025]|uniref:hypothetical protein n=1 Tax=Anaerocolumna sp. AGMB13025 TaxID=3039116 RepID=UPI00241D3E92|nr:hypothetical protein [Anaerocolumna sp. AGMB13025]WFR58085.1 hypothetical protein QA584_03200 [Anaerocolumna sp. AGMB13025]
MEKLMKAGTGIFGLGLISFLLSLVGLEFRSMRFLGEYKLYVEIACVVIGLILILIAKYGNKRMDDKLDEE